MIQNPDLPRQLTATEARDVEFDLHFTGDLRNTDEVLAVNTVVDEYQKWIDSIYADTIWGECYSLHLKFRPGEQSTRKLEECRTAYLALFTPWGGLKKRHRTARVPKPKTSRAKPD